ncbi:SGNH/GDSL hydrolase family protein [Roseibium sp.]|uniref:SGNH/GDSL hydrolase family protein n=1 Tax=Roseibium sp. TaxID=1936156 RepID=UPI003A97A026
MSLPHAPLSVVCFGDSLTWGFNPIDRSRYDHGVRWTRLMQEVLGPEFYVVEEGLNSRTTVFEDPVMGDKNGLAHLATVLESHKPIDILVIMLGTNNLKRRFNMSAVEIALSMERLIALALASGSGPRGAAPKILLMSPPPANDFSGTAFEEQFLGDVTQEISRRLAPLYASMAETYSIGFFETGSVVKTSAVDAIHLDPDTQPILARAIAGKVRELAG